MLPIPNPKLPKFIAADFALFAATWWPNASFENLRTITHVVIWLFVWDDELDQAGGVLSTDLEAAAKYRAESVEFVEGCLGFCGKDGEAEGGPPAPPSRIVESFGECAGALRGEYDDGEFCRLVLTSLGDKWDIRLMLMLIHE